MFAQVTINDVALGVVQDPTESVPFNAGHGRSRPRAVEFEFRREMGHQAEDPADDEIYRILAGGGRGAVEPVSLTVTYCNSANQQEIGTLQLDGATVFSYREDDTGAAVWQHVVIRAAQSTYTPAGGGAAVAMDVLADVFGKR